MNAHASTVERRWGAAIMSSFHAAFSGGGLAGAALGAALAAAAAAWVMGSAAALASALVAVAWTALRDKAAVMPTGPSLMLPGRASLPLCAAVLLCMLCEGAMADWSVVYFRPVAGALRGQAAAGYAAFSAAMLVGRLAGDGVVRALGRASVTRAGGALAAAAFALAVAMPGVTAGGGQICSGWPRHVERRAGDVQRGREPRGIARGGRRHGGDGELHRLLLRPCGHRRRRAGRWVAGRDRAAGRLRRRGCPYGWCRADEAGPEILMHAGAYVQEGAPGDGHGLLPSTAMTHDVCKTGCRAGMIQGFQNDWSVRRDLVQGCSLLPAPP